MKSTGVCPKCSSKKVAEIPSELGTYNVIKVDTRYICTSCGYMEQYVSDANSLSKLRREKRNHK
jgi:transposase-like protein